MCAARAYIMHIIVGALMLDANNNRIRIMYLPLLADLSNARSYSWGSAVLAVLYRELCRTKKPAAVDISGCLTFVAVGSISDVILGIIEWYHGDRVLRQFGCIQHIPDPPCNVGEVHGMNRRGKLRLHWGVKHRRFVAVWNDRMA
ncbi:hypothetical protein J1N35_000582 [Gossypium stocksii]|uniref:Aminotransferase-like plant mobile domain-containing protein n=1 Tax=Gossypium stocksii TaxID=47602 RepID=A0A9D3WH41_9ROSI|nr:hypothetical protein J1N35_000582 [Gossypium stocksii]